MGSAASSFIVDDAIIGLAQPLTEAHGNNHHRDSMQRRFPHDGFLRSRRLDECCYAVCVSGIERCRKWMYSPPLRSDCAILWLFSLACANPSCNLACVAALRDWDRAYMIAQARAKRSNIAKAFTLARIKTRRV